MKSAAGNFKADFVGYNSLKRAMAQAAPEIRKEMEREIRSIVAPIAANARQMVPPEPALSGWARSGVRRNDGKYILWDSKAARAGIRVFTGRVPSKYRAYTVARRIVQTSAAGAIFETAGKVSKGKGTSGQNFVRGLRKHGQPGRALYRAYDDAGGERVVVSKVENAIERWNREFQRTINNTGD